MIDKVCLCVFFFFFVLSFSIVYQIARIVTEKSECS
jgi:hypothetical protein